MVSDEGNCSIAYRFMPKKV
ncbi:MAG: hypothetical protein M0P07_07760 [Candidatus Methanomethylophilaceae archaeon]|nr:hypothetical protein [Candidatus Methanomethylophilaceae archaeon]